MLRTLRREGPIVLLLVGALVATLALCFIGFSILVGAAASDYEPDRPAASQPAEPREGSGGTMQNEAERDSYLEALRDSGTEPPVYNGGRGGY